MCITAFIVIIKFILTKKVNIGSITSYHTSNISFKYLQILTIKVENIIEELHTINFNNLHQEEFIFTLNSMEYL